MSMRKHEVGVSMDMMHIPEEDTPSRARQTRLVGKHPPIRCTYLPMDMLNMHGSYIQLLLSSILSNISLATFLYTLLTTTSIIIIN